MLNVEFTSIIYDKRDGIAKITINRPQALNALNPEVIHEIKRALEDAAGSNDVRVLIITGSGEKAFSAGADIKWMSNCTPLEALTFSQLGQSVLRMIEELDKPVIAAVNGYALGGGCELALACDLVIASENARFGQPEINVGIIPGWGGTQRLTRLVGVKKAKELILTGDVIDAKEAEKLGIVNKVVPREKLMEEAEALAKKLAEKTPIGLRMAKAAINKSLETSLKDGLDYEARLFGLLFTTEDAKEGLKAFLEKRKPTYKGK
ncbi:MAG: enoyl-CoA hydratase-related protein [Candidatus Nezhaarchaeales archaeon]